MSKKNIKKLAVSCFSGPNLDEKRVKIAAQKLKKGELKVFLSYLRKEKSKRTVYIEVPDINSRVQRMFSSFFPGKKIELIKNEDLMLGLRIRDDDFIFEYNLEKTLRSINEKVGQI